MALNDFKEQFDNAYQEVFQKILVGKEIANTRFESSLTYGASLKRVKYDISNVRVRAVTIGSDRTVDSVTDSTELINIDRQYGTTFALSTKEKVQAGPLNPASEIGAKVAWKTATFVDADVLYETVNAFADFDNGDLTTGSSDGTPITLSSTTVPQMVSRMPAKLKANNQVLQNLVFVIDAYGSADVIQYLLGKNIDFAETVFKNGYAGPIMTAQLYTSENLTGEAVITLSGLPSNGETMVINGVTVTFVSSIGSNPGNVLIGASATATADNLIGLINSPSTTSATQVALSASDQVKFSDTLRLSATNSSGVVTIVGKGSGRLVITESVSNLAKTKNFIHAYFGKKGAIDVVVQDKVDMEMREEPKQRAVNILSDVLYGVKTFSDGSQQFLDVMINA